tara:strand:+ start:109 stop:426 length:318 start_codon:yes stop_codon:yes gene_type:complete
MKISTLAQERIDQTLADTENLRVSVDGGGCSGYRIGLKKENSEEKKENDVWVTHNVLIDNISEGYLTTATLKWTTDEFQPTFKFDIPNTYSCGCGGSFQFEDEKL